MTKKRGGTAPDIDCQDPQALGETLAALLRQVNRPLGMDELLRVSHLPRKAKKKIEAALYRLQDEGRAVRSPKGWAWPGKLRQDEGVLSIQRSGAAFVTPQGGGSDIFVHPAALNDAWHGDTVDVLVLPGRRGPSREGRVLRVVSRARAELAAEAVRRQRDGLWLAAPQNTRVPALFITDVGALKEPVAEGDLLLVRPGDKAGPNLWHAEATVNLRHEATPSAQERIVKSAHSIPTSFPAGALAEAAKLPGDPGEADFTGRADLREAGFVTIDGRTARDFDDAIHMEPSGSGFRLRVAIADVSHYVPQGRALDTEARLRGNSYYFPLSVEPMLPEALSNGLCSLKPGVPRLAVVADMIFSAGGDRVKARFYEAVIRSAARLTYGQIERGLLLGEAEAEAELAPVLPMLRDAERFARILMQRRKERGSLDFDVPEASFVFDDEGALVSIQPRKRHFGHRLIEECMIAANEAAASFLEAENEPALYRVHQPPDPDKLASLVEYLAESGLYDKGGNAKTGRKRAAPPSSADLQAILAAVAGAPREYAVTRLLLRSMMQARYQPDNEGHYGLGSSAYTHFTSPIRRYADLVAHRALKRAMRIDGAAALSRAKLERTADHINACERTAVDAEREMHKRLAVLYLKDRVDEEFDGVVSGLTDFGIFVELPACMAEGMVRLTALTDDYYEYLPERQELRGRGTRRSFRLGQNLRVRVTDVNPGRLEINLAPVNAPGAASGAASDEAAGGKRERSGKVTTGHRARRGSGSSRGQSADAGGRGGAKAGKRSPAAGAKKTSGRGRRGRLS